MGGEAKEGLLKRPVTRRGFLKAAIGFGGALAVSSVGISGCAPAPSEQKKFSTPVSLDQTPIPTAQAPKKEKPTHFLTEEELEKAHIKIYQTPEVTLKLEEGVFDFPIFKDAREGKLKEVVLVLVDHRQISWNALAKVPEDARLVWQAVNVHPAEHPDQYWEDRKKYTKDMLDLLPQRLKLDQERAALEKDQKIKHLYEAMVADDEHLIHLYKDSLFLLNQGKEASIRTEEEFGVNWPEGETYGQMVRLDNEYDYPQAPNIQKKFQEFPETKKRFDKLKQEHPELNGKVFVYIAVGGSRQPSPQQSYPKTEQFKEDTSPSNKGKGGYRYLDRGGVGPTLRHEVSHYKTDSPSASEYEADTKMFESIEGAQTKKQTGDKSGYPFHFFTKEGEMITKRQGVNVV